VCVYICNNESARRTPTEWGGRNDSSKSLVDQVVVWKAASIRAQIDRRAALRGTRSLDQRSIEKSSGAGTRSYSSAVERSWIMSESPAKFESRTILLVDTRIAALRRTSDLLRRAGHHVIEAASFDDAKKALWTRAPALVISSLRLAAFNGLHLVHLARLNRPEMSAIIMSGGADAVLQSEAERVGASLLVEPVPPSDLLSLIDRMFEADTSRDADPLSTERRHSDRRRASASVDVAFDRRVADRRVAVPVRVLRDGGASQS